MIVQKDCTGRLWSGLEFNQVNSSLMTVGDLTGFDISRVPFSWDVTTTMGRLGGKASWLLRKKGRQKRRKNYG